MLQHNLSMKYSLWLKQVQNNVLFYDIKYIINTVFLFTFCVWKRMIANKWLNGTTEAVRDIKRYHTKRV